MKLTLNFRSLGLDAKKGKAFPAVDVPLKHSSPANSAALAAIVSAQAEKLVPGLKEKDLRVRITTPDGRPWDLPTFYVEDATTGARYGWGTASLKIHEGRNGWREFSVWNG